jgi:hypothetical protein
MNMTVVRVLRAVGLYEPARAFKVRRERRNIGRHADSLHMAEVYRAFIKPGDLVFDIGANRGNRSVIFHDLLEARVIAVEPQPGCQRLLREVFAGAPRFTLEPVGLGSEANCQATWRCPQHRSTISQGRRTGVLPSAPACRCVGGPSSLAA